MKVLLVQPRTPGTESWSPPLGLGYLAAALEGAGHEVAILDLDTDGGADDVTLVGRARGADVVGFTTTMASAPDSLRMAGLLDTPTVLFGGAQASARPETFATRPEHIAVIGEAERSAVQLLRVLEQGGALESVPGIAFLDATGGLRLTKRMDPVGDLDSLPMPARHLFDMDSYDVQLCGGRATTIMSTRGCPFDCFFCYHDFHGKKYRCHSTERVLAEIDHLTEVYGYRSFLFYDDNFTHRRERVELLCRALLDRGVQIRWRCYSRVNAVDRELLALMCRAGCAEIVFGVESGSQNTLDRVHKGITVAQSLEAVRLCAEAGIATKAYLVIGFPWETKDDIRMTLDLIPQLHPSQVMLVVATPFPATPFEKWLIDHDMSIDASVDITGIAEPSFDTENWTRDELRALRDEGYARIRKAAAQPTVSYRWREQRHWQRQFSWGPTEKSGS